MVQIITMGTVTAIQPTKANGQRSRNKAVQTLVLWLFANHRVDIRCSYGNNRFYKLFSDL